jgi:hypothetical protein
LRHGHYVRVLRRRTNLHIELHTCGAASKAYGQLLQLPVAKLRLIQDEGLFLLSLWLMVVGLVRGLWRVGPRGLSKRSGGEKRYNESGGDLLQVILRQVAVETEATLSDGGTTLYIYTVLLGNISSAAPKM